MWFRRKPKPPLDITVHAPGPFRKGTSRRGFFKQTAGVIAGAVVATKVKVTGNAVPVQHVAAPPRVNIHPPIFPDISASFSYSMSRSPSPSESASPSPTPSCSWWEGEHGERE